MLAIFLNPAIVGLASLFLAIVWMLRDEKDKNRPLLVFALILNLIFGTIQSTMLAREGALLALKYDHILLLLDRSLGISAASVAIPLQGFCRVPLLVIYLSLVPMMIGWIAVTRYWNSRGSVVLAYAAELVAGPLLYAVSPGCGPVYAFAAQWLHPPAVHAEAIRLTSFPNAFPSLHLATAFVFVFFAPGRGWRGISLAFFTLTALATLSTGEHYVIDLVGGLATGCFAAAVGRRATRSALFYLGVALAWSMAVRFGYPLLIAYPLVTRTLAASTALLAISAVFREWSFRATQASSRAG
ncbi:MAG: phosphatase PAP2 family protein [Terracidiphilus sp.]